MSGVTQDGPVLVVALFLAGRAAILLEVSVAGLLGRILQRLIPVLLRQRSMMRIDLASA
jgi:hypothetical protein